MGRGGLEEMEGRGTGLPQAGGQYQGHLPAGIDSLGPMGWGVFFTASPDRHPQLCAPAERPEV